VPDLTLDQTVLTPVLSTLVGRGGPAAPPPPPPAPPSISLCGSDEVIGAYVQAFRMVAAQDATCWAGWAELGGRAVDVLAELGRVDASLAAGLR
jgi:hypothetical protein